MEYHIGIIDDEAAKITQLLFYLDMGWEDNSGSLIKEKYKNVKLIPEEIPLESTIDSMVEKIGSGAFDALIVDFKLSSKQNVSYSGVALAQAVDKKLRGFPIFILTSYQDDLYNKECFDVYQVFDFERYIKELDERIEINSKIVEQIKKYRTTLNKWKEELASLIALAGTNASIDDRILELDSLIENSIDGTSALPSHVKKTLSDSTRIQQIIDKIDKVIKEG